MGKHIHIYADRFNDQKTDLNKVYKDVSIKFADKYKNMTYEKAVYPSDVKVNNTKDLDIKIKYKIAIKNLSTTYDMKINNVIDYYDEKFDTENIKVTYEENGQVKEELNVKDLGTKKLEIDTSKLGKITAQEEKVFYIELKVKNDQINKLISRTEKVEEVELVNYAEIASYTTYKGNTAVAGIDSNSRPGNLDISKFDTTGEDDSDRAPGFKIVLGEERKISGIVFIDKSTNTLAVEDKTDTGNTRQGDGVYIEGEDQLITDESVRVLLFKEGESGSTAMMTNIDENGEFEFKSFTPGNYYLKFIWGSSTYTIQNYKGTTVNGKNWSLKNNNNQWYKNIEPRESDAIDNYDIRENIDKDTNEITNSKLKEIQKEYEENRAERMESITPVFRVNLEYNINETTQDDEYEKDDKGNYKEDLDGKKQISETFKNHLKNIDFGITERARQELTLEKAMKEIKLTLTNGQVLIDGKINDEGKFENNVKYIQYIPKTTTNEQMKIEIDSEIIKGAQLEITYKIIVKNTSELDYHNKNYYLFGIDGEKSEIVTLKAENIIDYFDANTIFEEAVNENWKQILTKENDEVDQIDVDDEVKEYIKTRNNVAISNGVVELKPEGQTDATTETSITLTTTKLISDADDEIVENHAEIIKVNKSYGALLTSILGNYVPTNSLTSEIDNFNSGNIVVIPATGLGIDIIAYIILSISSLGILTSGIVLIKKYVLNK